jgi:hygromycin-B 4-O-kinase
MTNAANLPQAADAGAFLRGHLGREASALEWVGEGAWSRCFGFEDQRRELVIRFGRYLDDFEKDQRAASFASAALPILEVFEIGVAFDGYFVISARARGVPLEALDRAGWVAVLPSLFGALDALRGVDLSLTPGYGDWDRNGSASERSWRKFLVAIDTDSPERRTHGWREKLIASPIGDELFRAAHALLAELSEQLPDLRSLVHSDLINRNVLVADGRICAIFDWGCSFYGDFLYDVAWLAFWSPWFEALAALDVVQEAERHYASIGLRVPNLRARMRCCMLHIGLVHLAYNAHTGSLEDLVAVAERIRPLLEDSA